MPVQNSNSEISASSDLATYLVQILIIIAKNIKSCMSKSAIYTSDNS